MRGFRPVSRAWAVSVALLAAGTSFARADEFHPLYRGARPMAMGNAFVAFADGEDALFMNPAGMAMNERVTINYLIADITMSWDTVLTALEGLTAMSEISGDTINLVMGKNIHARAQITPNLLVPSFGIGLMVDGQAAMLAENPSLPQLNIGYQNTNGVQAAFGFNVLGGGRRKRIQQRSALNLGIGAKLLWRRGGYRTLPLTTLFNLSEDILSEIAGSYGRGIGVDVGAQYHFQANKRLTLGAGLVYTDVGDTRFVGGGQAIKGDFTAGVGARYALGKIRLGVSYDYKNILNKTDWRKRNHAGVEIAMPLFSLYGGINQTSFTYGGTFDIWLFRITGASYGEERGAFVRMDTERRYMLKIALKLGL